MVDPVFTKTPSIIIKSVSTDTYGNLVFTDENDVVRKISSNRIAHFKDVIKPNMGVTLNYCANPHGGNDMLWNATPVAQKLPAKAELSPPVKALEAEQTAKGNPPAKEPRMTNEDWADKDRITRQSIHRQVALKASVEMAKMSETGKATPNSVIATAKLFEAYLEGEATKSRLVQEVEKLGVKVEMKEENEERTPF